MRPNLAVLAAVIALVSRCTAVSAASTANQINLSNLNQALETMPNHAGDGNRFLRSAEIVNDDIDSDDDVDRDEEERGGKTWAEKFAKWHARGESADDVYARFALEPVVRQAYKYGQIGRLDDNEYYRKWAAYSAYLKDKGLN
ncbi:hypothetical protein DVH05_020089 [Phytophthora capsici]|nr:hypothetical protein DVH05_020085 [Phytophthora capsici]KAG1709434.1 hypothetical protein DVH05_020089 [Phytophthora capsici]